MSKSCEKIYKLILFYINGYDGVCVTNFLISEKLNMPEPTVRYNISYLLKNNIIGEINIGGKTRVYYIPNTIPFNKRQIMCNIILDV